MRLAQHHLLFSTYLAMRIHRQVATLHTDGVHLCYLVSYRHQLRHRAKGHSSEIHIQTSHNHSDAIIGKLVADIGQSHIEKLSLVYTHYIDI